MILVFSSSIFLTDCSKAVLLYLCSSLTYCLVCVLQPCGQLLGKGLRPTSLVRQVQPLLDPLFGRECFPPCPFYSFPLVFFFELTSVFIYETLRTSLIDLAKVLKQAVTEIGVMGRVARKPKVVAFQQQRHRPACTDAQSNQRLYCSIS